VDLFFLFIGGGVGKLLELNLSLNVSYPGWERLRLQVPGLYAAASVGAGRRYSPQPGCPRVKIGRGSSGRGRPRACTGT
jgi:hypothetical protein